MLDTAKPWVCAAAAVAPPITLLALGGESSAGFGLAGLVLLACGRASAWLLALAALPAFQFVPSEPPPELAEAIQAAGVAGPGVLAADPSALLLEMRGLAGCLAAYALGRSAATSEGARRAAVAAVAALGCFEGALGLAGSGYGGIAHRGQYAALLELTFGAGCGLLAAAWAGRRWRERLNEIELLWAALGFAAIALSLGSISVSLSRTGIVAGLLAAVVAAVWFSRRRSVALAAGIALLFGLAVTAPRALDRFEQLAESGGDPGRTAIWADSLQLAQNHWLTGVGMGSFPSVFRRSSFYLPRKGVDNAHSDYLEWIVELGLPAALLLFGTVLAGLSSIDRRDPLAAGCAIGVAAVLLHATVDLPLQSPGLAALTAAMLGLASPAWRKRPRSPRLEPSPRVSALPTCAAILGLAALALAYTRVETPEERYTAAEQASVQGDAEKAAQLYRATLDQNLYAAPAWLRLSEIARSRGDARRAMLFARAAREVEPFTLRTEWPLAELELEAGLHTEAARRLAGLIASAPDLLDAALLTASRSGVTPADLESLTPPADPEAAGRYLAFLVRAGHAERVPGAYARLGAPKLPRPYRDWLAREAGFRP